MKMYGKSAILGGSALIAFAATGTAYAQQAEADTTLQAPDAASNGGLQDIVVTAQKRSQSLNDVPVSVSTASGDTLIQRGISSTADLARIVPGLTAQPSPFNTPVYTLRGVGFYDSTLSASPTVAVYTDEIPLPFSAMTKAASLDVTRVEVLKGPQGTLFGQNTTGGAINYVAAKPTRDFAAGADISFGRFNTLDAQGYVSGPLGDTLGARIAVRTIQSGDWQRSYVSGNTLGARRETQGRLLLDWRPTDDLSIVVNFNGWIDKSDTQAAQRVANQLSVPANVDLGAPTLAYPLAPSNARAADWTTTIEPLRRDDYFVQGSIRADYELTDAVTVTSVSALQRYKTRAFQDFDGIALSIADVGSRGHINSFSQELRLSGTSDRMNWVIGGNYSNDRTYDALTYYYPNSTTGIVGPFYIGGAPSLQATTQNVKTYAAFGNVEYEILPGLKAQAGLRYTKSDRSFAGCTYDVDGPNSQIRQAFEFLQSILRGSITPIAPGGCVTLGPDFVPGNPNFTDTLEEDNLSWRANLAYKTANNGLLYASVSRGYKAGSFPTTAAAASAQLAPVKQESLTAYEVGFKQPLFDRRLQVNGAAYYYDYQDKQLRGRILDPVFGPLDALVQIPKSRIYGFEAEIVARPVTGLDLSFAASYVNTRIKEFVGYNSAAVIQDFRGAQFPYTPQYTVVADGQYDFPISSRLNLFVGGSLTYNSKALASIGNVAQLTLPSYTLLDARFGIRAENDSWRAQLWGRNLTNEYYWTNALQTQDGYVRYAGKPVTYGVSVGFRF